MVQSTRHVIMVASENGALAGGKFGGVGDAIRDLPRALAAQGWRVTIIIPSYGFLHFRNHSSLLTNVTFPFGGEKLTGEMWKVEQQSNDGNITHLLFNHSEIAGDPIYFNDPSSTPF